MSSDLEPEGVPSQDGNQGSGPAFQSRSAIVRNILRDRILSGELTMGTLLVERQIAEELGVSKTPVREAIRSLSATGLVEVGDYQRAKVSTFDADAIQQHHEFRLLLEPAAVRMAGERAPDASARDAAIAFEQALEHLRTGRLEKLALANREFHRALYRHCRNRQLRDALDRIQDVAALVSVFGWREHASWATEAQEHRAILERICLGDPAGAEILMREHIEGFCAKSQAQSDRGVTTPRRNDTTRAMYMTNE